ncbi:tetratricopeptide repeat protein [Streptomyces sp. NPDC055632]
MNIHPPGGPREPVRLPHRVGSVPSRATAFLDRAEAARLRDAVAGGGTAVVGQVLSGMGGVGKTQLAADHAHTAWDADELDVLVWVTATDRAAVIAAYARAGAELCGADPGEPEQAAQEFRAWLVSRPGPGQCRWLVVLDDIADPDHVAGLWPPTSPHGRVLATTRRKDAALTGDGRRRIDIGLFSPGESATYLAKALAAHGRTDPAPEVGALARDLGHLPLALSQAAAYLADTGESAETYRALLADRTAALAEAAPDRLPDDQRHTVAACWSLSLERADALRPAGLARPMLHLASMLDPNGIPADVLTSAPARTHLAAHSTTTPTADAPTSPEPVPPREATLALSALHRLSLIDHDPATPWHAVRVHQLVQRATRDTLTPTEYEQAAHAAADALVAVWPDIERDTALAQALRVNTTALTRCADAALHRPRAHGVLFRAGSSLGDGGQVVAATDYFRRLADTTTHHLGPDHPDTRSAWHRLAYFRGEAGDPAGAAEAFAELLADTLRALGPDHKHTLTDRSQLARWRGEAGDPAGAAEAFAELLADYLRVLGPDYPGTLIAWHQLAYFRGEAGDPAGAAEAFAELLADSLRVRGPDHPDNLIVRSQLARWRGEAGDPAGAAEALAELLADRVRVLGPDHPDTFNTRGQLARFRGEVGDPAGAAEALAELLADRVRVLGPDHRHTLTDRYQLAFFQGAAGDPAGAAEALAELLADHVRVLGPDHRHTLIDRYQLACFQREAGDPAGAAEAFAELLADHVRVLGPDHPDTLTDRYQLANFRGEAGDPAGAAEAFAELLADYLRVLGPDHKDTLATRNNLAFFQGAAGDPAGAAEAFAELLADHVRVLGPDHKDTLTTRKNLARWRGEAADPSTGSTSKNSPA